MKVVANVVLGNEACILKQVAPIWATYPIDEWVIFDDRSTDNTLDVLKEYLSPRLTIIRNDREGPFHETYARDKMLEHSRSSGADYIIALDADELLSADMVGPLHEILKVHDTHDIHYFWYNFVGTVKHRRNDPLYEQNWKSFIMPVKHTGSFKQYDQLNIHCARTAPISLPKAAAQGGGLLHFQSIDKEFYALKQLWYKHWEYVDLGQSVETLNQKYDPVVNGLNFHEVETPEHIIDGIDFDPSIFKELLKIKGYKEYVQQHRVDELITFGQEYL